MEQARSAYVKQGWIKVRMASSFCQGASAEFWILVRSLAREVAMSTNSACERSIPMGTPR